MDISIVFQTIFLISIMILLGALLSRTFNFNDDTRQMLLSFIINIAMPSIILSSIFNVDISKISFQMIAIVFLLSICINIAGIALGWFSSGFFRRTREKKQEISILSGLGNTGFIGIPLCAVLFGPEGALFAAIFDAGVDLTLWTVGVFILQEDKKLSFKTIKPMINIPTIAIVVGLLSAYFGIQPPAIIGDLMDRLAGLAVPLAMFYIGIIIMNLEYSKLHQASSTIWLPILIKLLILPISVFIIIFFLPINTFIVQIILIQSMMPTLTLASVLFSKHSGDTDMGAIATVLATIIALTTIPTLIYIMNFFMLS